ncbi:MAG: hemolysin family protein [Rothia sp. (in: high G+C Gram-positive bacteria)]|uniref:hemolysin family protein n=1 Tax=Rothia sp. (in: high G+C Gram-positive bacteria) TaxID=1885016 RepID=UPI0026FAF5F1|nr:hemolysin family protein [Rothia sp. (in: high G+C Gram-positive bacteria)]
MEWLLLLIGFILILGTGFFVAVEFSLVALDQSKVQQEIDRGDAAGERVLACLKSLSTQLSSCQLGITITTLLTGYTLDSGINALAGDTIASWGLAPSLASALTLIFSMGIATLLSMIIGELVPKNLAIAEPYRVARVLAPGQLLFTKVMGPIVRTANGSANWILHRFGMEAKEELSAARSPEELSSMVRRSADLGTLDSDTARFVDKTLSFAELTAADVMTPRRKVIMLEDTAPVSDVIELARTTGHSRFPLYREDQDNIVGVIHVKKAVGLPLDKRDVLEAGALMEDVLQVPETVHLDSLLMQLREGALQLAVVLDEYGGTAGITTLEDLVEEIVGEVSDEHDTNSFDERPLRVGNGDYIFSGLLRPDEVKDYIGTLDVDEDPAYETMGGFMMDHLGRVPETGDLVPVEGGRLRVEKMEQRRVDRIRYIPEVHPLEGADATTAGSFTAGKEARR